MATINKFEEWFLKRLCKKIVMQSFDHRNNIIDYFVKLREAARDEFNEDNKVTLDFFLSECYDEALKREKTRIYRLVEIRCKN